MSLILTQSDSTPGSNPASYVNRFKNTFQIKANAEIAVQEVVLNRMGRFDVSKRARIYFRHGVDDWHTPLMAMIVAGTYSPEELAAHVETNLNLFDSHPQYQGGWKCNVVRNGDIFDRFNIHVDQQLPVTDSSPPASGEFTQGGGMSYVAATGVMTTTDRGALSLKQPISANTGEILVSVASKDNLTGKLVILLDTDAVTNPTSSVSMKHSMFGVQLDARTDSMTILQHNPETTKLETIHVSSAVFFAADHTHIKVKLEGEKLSVFVGTSGDEENTTVFNAFTHINSAIYALFPKITVDKNSTVTLHKYSGVAGFNETTSVATQFSLNSAQLKLALSRAHGTTDTTYTTVSNGFLDTISSLVFSPYDTVMDANMGKEMGFAIPNMAPHSTQTVASTKHREIWHGSTELSISSDGLLYVRLTGLTFESQNGAVQGPSRIIQPLARFTDNKTSGRMHFVPPQRTYLKLHNPAKLSVQEMQIDIVNADETIATDLQDTTYVALHVR